MDKIRELIEQLEELGFWFNDGDKNSIDFGYENIRVHIYKENELN